MRILTLEVCQALRFATVLYPQPILPVRNREILPGLLRLWTVRLQIVTGPYLRDTENPYAAVVKLILDPGGSSASADPNFDESICGKVVTSFTSEEILSSLQANAAQGVTLDKRYERSHFSMG